MCVYIVRNWLSLCSLYISCTFDVANTFLALAQYINTQHNTLWMIIILFVGDGGGGGCLHFDVNDVNDIREHKILNECNMQQFQRSHVARDSVL